MLSDRGVSTEFSPESSNVPGWRPAPGYTCPATASSAPLSGTRLWPRRRWPQVSVDLSSTAAVEAFGVNAFDTTARTPAEGRLRERESEAELVPALSRYRRSSSSEAHRDVSS